MNKYKDALANAIMKLFEDNYRPFPSISDTVWIDYCCENLRISYDDYFDIMSDFLEDDEKKLDWLYETGLRMPKEDGSGAEFHHLFVTRDINKAIEAALSSRRNYLCRRALRNEHVITEHYDFEKSFWMSDKEWRRITYGYAD